MPKLHPISSAVFYLWSDTKNKQNEFSIHVILDLSQVILRQKGIKMPGHVWKMKNLSSLPTRSTRTNFFNWLNVLWHDFSSSPEPANAVNASRSLRRTSIFRITTIFSVFKLSLWLFLIESKHCCHAISSSSELLRGANNACMLWCWMRRWQFVWMRATRTPKHVCMVNVRNVMFGFEI